MPVLQLSVSCTDRSLCRCVCAHRRPTQSRGGSPSFMGGGRGLSVFGGFGTLDVCGKCEVLLGSFVGSSDLISEL